MPITNNIRFKIREYHRYLGFFLAGIMAVYAISGIVLIFRDTDFLKVEKKEEKTLATNMDAEALGKSLRIRNLKVDKEENGIYYFEAGTYNKSTGLAQYTTKELPLVLDKMTHMHKAKSGDPLFFLNIFFGLSLLFFVVSAFFMFIPKTPIFKKGMIFVAVGAALTLLLLFL